MKGLLYVVIGLVVLSAVHGLGLSEIMYNPMGTDTGREWVEAVVQEDMNMSQARFFDNEGSHTLSLKQGVAMVHPGDVVIITNDAAKFAIDYPGFFGNLFQASFSLSNTGEGLGFSLGGIVLDEYNYTTIFANGNGMTLEKRDGLWGEGTVLGGTPGEAPSENEVPEFGIVGAGIALLGALIAFVGLRKR